MGTPTAVPALPPIPVTPVQDPGPIPHLQGRWNEPFALKNVAIHAHLLPNGKVLFWGRRKQPTDNSFESLNEHETHTFLLDVASQECVPTSNQPFNIHGQLINLFCSSHTFLPDGRLMVTGGHLYDSQGIDCASIYDWRDDLWSAADPMQGHVQNVSNQSFWQNGRWYPTAITLADGSVFVCSGSYATDTPAPLPHAPGNTNNSTPEIWNETPWKQLTPFIEQTDLHVFLFPRFHLAPDGRVFLSGAGADSFFFDTSGTGNWEQSATRVAGNREYAPSVMYDTGKIVFIGGGNGPDQNRPTDTVERINLNDPSPIWVQTGSLNIARRQHNATILPDGTVLVTGGTSGGGGETGGFNDLTPGMPAHGAELWDPKTDIWTELAAEGIDRCYHSTALLLPDGRVMSAGGGEYQPVGTKLKSNDAADSHLTAQIFHPPYLFKGPRPLIESSPHCVRYGDVFRVSTPDAKSVVRASLIRLSSVTHSFNTGQMIVFLTFDVGEDAVHLTAPSKAEVCPPGHYLLFLLTAEGVPSKGEMMHVTGDLRSPERSSVKVVDQVLKNQALIDSAKRHQVVIGLSPICPYGLGTCSAGALGALKKLDGVETVRMIADNRESTAYLYLNHDGLPDMQQWPVQFAQAVSTYAWRGVEMTLDGTMSSDVSGLMLAATADRPAVLLAPLQRDDKVQIDQEDGVERPLPQAEAEAYTNLAAAFAVAGTPAVYSITGPLQQKSSGYVLQVRLFEQLSPQYLEPLELSSTR